MTLLWTATAVGHLAAIHEYISQTSPFYADRMVNRILARGSQLTTFPDSGRQVPELGLSGDRSAGLGACHRAWQAIRDRTAGGVTPR